MWKDGKARKTRGFGSKNLGLNICSYLLIKCEVENESEKMLQCIRWNSAANRSLSDYLTDEETRSE